MATTAQPLDTPQLRPSVWDRRRRTLSNALIITRREVRDSFRDWRIMAPIIVLTFFFPFLAQFGAQEIVDFVSGYGADLIGDRTIPLLLMLVGFFPISISLVIALETFVGEKERRSLEPLLSTPLSNTELYIGKTLAAMIPPLVSAYGGIAVYLSSLLTSELEWRPQPMLVVQIILLTTVQALVMVTGSVVVSSQTTSTRAANLLASFIIIPMTLIIMGESVIMFLAPDAASPNGVGVLWWIIVGMLVVVILLLRVGNSLFNREELLGRTIDQINLKRIFGDLWRYARAIDDDGTPAQNLRQWVLRAIPYSLRKLKAPAAVAVLVFVVAFGAGFFTGLQPEWQLPIGRNPQADDQPNLVERLIEPGQVNPLYYVETNGRILLAATLLSVFSFGVASLTLTPAVYLLLGYIVSQAVLSGHLIPGIAPGEMPALLFAAVMTHGIVEIPVIVIAVAAALRLGSIVTKPPQGQTVGRAWTIAFGDTFKLWLGVVIPGLIVAALIESYLTPIVVNWVQQVF